MKQGQVLHGYLIVSKPSNDGAGKCMWARAEKDGGEYFVKEFLEPKRPRPESMGSPATKQRLLAQCAEFERRHWSVIDKIDPSDLDAGNLVTAIDFFAEGTRYYKVTDLLHPADHVVPHELSTYQKRVLLGTLADSLTMLHRLGIVHGDLKPQNVLLHQPPGSNLYTAKLIDFDDAYVSGNPPARDAIGGDLRYGAPELLRYMQGDPAVTGSALTTASDLFAFGLMVHGYLAGSLPVHDPMYSSPAEAVNAGQWLPLDPRLHARAADAVQAMILAAPADRPRAAELVDLLSDEAVLSLGRHAGPAARPGREPAGRSRPSPSGRPGEPGGGRPQGSSRVISSFPSGAGGRERARPGRPPGEPAATGMTPPPAAEPPPDRPSRLRINLTGRTPAVSNRERHD